MVGSEAMVARPLAPEDVLPGQWVSVLWYVDDMLTWCPFDGPPPGASMTPVMVRWLPPFASEPLKVKAVCLPWALVRRPNGDVSQLDVRRFTLAKLDRDYAKKAAARIAACETRKRSEDAR